MKKTVSIITIILGIVVVIMGLCCLGKAERFDSGYYYVKSASFGADFYTYTYDALETITDQLGDVEEGIEVISKNQKQSSQETAMVIIAIGIGVFCYGLNGIANANAETPETKNTSKSETAPFETVKEEEKTTNYEGGIWS